MLSRTRKTRTTGAGARTRRSAITIFALSAGTLGACAQDALQGPDSPDEAFPLRPRFPVDGSAPFSILPLVFEGSVPWQGSPAGSSATVRVAQLNDDQDLYLAVEWSDPTRDDDPDLGAVDQIEVVFDSNRDGRFAAGDDVRAARATHGGSIYRDGHLDQADLIQKDVVGNGLGRLAYDPAASAYQAEFLIELAGDARGQDVPLATGTPFAIRIRDGGSAPVHASPWGATDPGAPTAAWPTLALEPTGALSRAALPAQLRGLMAVLSEHEGTRRLYLYRPASGALTHVPIDDALFIRNLALSPDWNWLALEASWTPEDPDTYEIYRVGSDGTRLEQLTDNRVWDGTPAWHPQGDRIVYASERDEHSSGRRHASIVIMTADGTELDDLSTDAFDDRDPVYLLDGRIAMKTTRVSPWPRYRIAAVRESGASFDILTEGLGGSDHHPVPRGEWIYYERFRAPTDDQSDPAVRAKPWDVLSVHRLGGQGSTLVTDGWANRRPVADPTGQYVAYLRQSDHSWIELVSREGTYLGRLLPEVTEVVRLDWR